MAASARSVSLLVFFAIISLSEARDLLVGGKTEAWKVPSSEADSLNKWSQNARFIIGDSLVWKYDSKKDSVLQVNKKDYSSCNTSSPIAEYKDGNTKIELDHSGPFYFISGAEGHCVKGEKLVVVVLSERHSKGFAPAPAPASPGIAVPPTTGGAASFNGGLVVALGAAAFSGLVLM